MVTNLLRNVCNCITSVTQTILEGQTLEMQFLLFQSSLLRYAPVLLLYIEYHMNIFSNNKL